MHKDGLIKYYDMDMTQKGTINLNRQCYCVSKDKDKGFELHIIGRTYFLFSELAGYCAKWVKDIESVIATL